MNWRYILGKVLRFGLEPTWRYPDENFRTYWRREGRTLVLSLIVILLVLGLIFLSDHLIKDGYEFLALAIACSLGICLLAVFAISMMQLFGTRRDSDKP